MHQQKPPDGAPVVYRARVRTADGETAEAFTVEPREGEPAQQVYRFKVRTPDGREYASAVVVGTPTREISIHLRLGDHRSRQFQIVAAAKTISGTTDAEGVVKASIPKTARARITVQGERGPQTLTLHVEQVTQ